jgi:hypothetical protein
MLLSHDLRTLAGAKQVDGEPKLFAFFFRATAPPFKHSTIKIGKTLYLF